jgi:hypothetical protein
LLAPMTIDPDKGLVIFGSSCVLKSIYSARNSFRLNHEYMCLQAKDNLARARQSEHGILKMAGDFLNKTLINVTVQMSFWLLHHSNYLLGL